MAKKSPQKDKLDTSCCYTPDPYADLPPEQRPKNKTWKSGLRKVACVGCGTKFWTNSEGNLSARRVSRFLQWSSRDEGADGALEFLKTHFKGKARKLLENG